MPCKVSPKILRVHFMKKVFFGFIACCLLTVPARGQLTATEYSRRCTELDSLRKICWQKKDFHTASNLLAEMHSLYCRLADSDRTTNRWVDANVLYNSACALALSDSADRAAGMLASSVDAGFADYYTMVADDDLRSLRTREDYQELLSRVREKGDFTQRLKRAAAYAPGGKSAGPDFSYQSADDSNLVRLRTMYRLDSVAGDGDELSRIVNLMRWAHHSVRHDGSSSNPLSRNAIDIIEICRKESRGVNCRMMATILNEAYLAMGFRSRHLTCLPMDTADTDCHVITIVYAPTLKKWIWMDPTFEAYVTDGNGTYLNPPEVRERLIHGDTVAVSDGINWNGKPYDGGGQGYLKLYMAKNLYWFECPAGSEFGYESKQNGKMYVALFPMGYNPRGKVIEKVTSEHEYYTRNPEYFWELPPGN
jgi:hypothetical protein